jgi:hypothetical protein
VAELLALAAEHDMDFTCQEYTAEGDRHAYASVRIERRNGQRILDRHVRGCEASPGTLAQACAGLLQRIPELLDVGQAQR